MYVERCLEWFLPNVNDIIFVLVADLFLHLYFYSALYKCFKSI